MASNVGRPRLVKKAEVKNGMATKTEKFDHWSDAVVEFSFDERVEPFSGFEDAYNALADQAASREEKDKDGNVKEGKDRNSLVLADLLDLFNGYVRRDARAAAVSAHMASLGIDDASEGLYKSLVTTIRAKLDAKNPGDSNNLKVARQKALEKVRSLSLDE